MSKQMEKTAMAAYQRDRRAKKKAVALAGVNPPVNPVNVNPGCQAPVNPVAPCALCADKDREMARLTLVNGELRTQLAIAQAGRQQARQEGKAHDDDASLFARVVATKVGRITSCNTGHTIGTAR